MTILNDFLIFVERYKSEHQHLDLPSNILVELFTQSTNIGKSELSIIDKIYERAVFGYIKYGTNTDREDLQTEDWITHAIEEQLDASIYLQRLKTKLNENL